MRCRGMKPSGTLNVHPDAASKPFKAQDKRVHILCINPVPKNADVSW
jgi:hypothetical protein